MFLLSVITVTHNHEDYLNRCLNSLVFEVNNLSSEILVIDNQSDDDCAVIARRYPHVSLHINQERRGFSANSNYGMALAQGRYLLLLNPDTEVLPGALQTLITFMDEHPKVGMCGAQLLFPDGKIQPSPRRFPTLRSVIARRTPLRRLLQNSRFNQHHLMVDIDHSKIQPVDWLLGACLLVRREALEAVGPLDEGFFLYVEDIDWARRMQAAGWQVWYVPTAKIVHHHLAISDKHFWSRYTWFHTQSMIRYMRKYLIPPIPWFSIKDNQSDIWQKARLAQSTRQGEE